MDLRLKIIFIYVAIMYYVYVYRTFIEHRVDVDILVYISKIKINRKLGTI